MRRPRIKANGEGYYHCMSRIIERRQILGASEKQVFLSLMRRLSGFSGIDVLTYCLMDNHFHILLHVPRKREVRDRELLERLRFILTPDEVQEIGDRLRSLREQGLHSDAEAFKARYTYRMFDVSEYFKALKQRFSQFYNTREKRCGPLWEQRFKSVVVERSDKALSTIAAYIELNPVRAGLVADPKDYRFSAYGEAVAGGAEARTGLQRLMEAVRGRRASWGGTQCAYREHLYLRGQQKGLNANGQAARAGFSREQVEKVLAQGGRLSVGELLRCRVRYFSDGLAIGAPAYLELLFQRYRSYFSPNRLSGARAMRHGDWGGLCTLRGLRMQAVIIS